MGDSGTDNHFINTENNCVEDDLFDGLDFEFNFCELEHEFEIAEIIDSMISSNQSRKKRKLLSSSPSTTSKKLSSRKFWSCGHSKTFISLEDMLEKQTKQPIHNRQQPRLLQAFPNFDKCDSLLYFANTLTRHFNCGDYPGVHKLMSSHLDKTYRISMNHCCFEEGFSCRNFVRLFELMGDLQPDRIMCVHTTKVEKNQIKSTIFMKFKDVKFLYDSIVPRIQDPHFQAMWGGKKRSDAFQRKIQADGRPAEEVDYLMKLVDTDLDLTVNVRLELILTFDPLTKKVTDMEFKGKMLSMVPLESHR